MTDEGLSAWSCCVCKKDLQIDATNEFVAQQFWEDDHESYEASAPIADGTPREESPKEESKTLSRCLADVALLRGTSLANVLRGLGKELRTSKLSTEEEAEYLYGQSTSVSRIDYFISHCWSDDRSGKVFALWIHSNLNAAMLISTALAVTCTSLCRARVLPVVALPDLDFEFFPWAFILGYTTFFLILATWQNVLARFRTTHYFLDKFCVHQTDLQLKHAGVASFAAFVSMSDCLLLLWSPMYFQRLWCFLEISALVKSSLADESKRLPLQFIPLQLAKLSFYLWLTIFLVILAVQINTVFNKPVPDIPIIIATCAIAAYLQIAGFRRYARDRRFLEQQLRSFSVQEAKCSDAQDRHTIEATILSWFETSDLEVCNQLIRDMVSDKVLASLGPAQHYPTRMLLPLLLLHLFLNADYAAGTWFDVDTIWRFLGPVLGFGTWMMVMVPLCFRLSHCCAQKCGSRCCDMLLNSLLAVIVTIGWFGGWYVNYLVVGYRNHGTPSWLAVLLPFLELILLFWLQRASLRCLFSSTKSRHQ